MPGLMSIRKRIRSFTTIKREQRVAGCTCTWPFRLQCWLKHLVALGAEVKWSSCNIFSTRDHAAYPLLLLPVSVFAGPDKHRKKQTGVLNKHYCLVALIVHWTWSWWWWRPWPTWCWIKYPELVQHVKGISEKQLPVYTACMSRVGKGTLPMPLLNVNDSVTKSKFDNKYGCKEIGGCNTPCYRCNACW